MVEFRWLDAPLMTADTLGYVYQVIIPRQKILQFRTIGQAFGLPEWSEWKYVPTVKWESLNDHG